MVFGSMDRPRLAGRVAAAAVLLAALAGTTVFHHHSFEPVDDPRIHAEAPTPKEPYTGPCVACLVQHHGIQVPVAILEVLPPDEGSRLEAADGPRVPRATAEVPSPSRAPPASVAA